jgi:hypothetical protein
VEQEQIKRFYVNLAEFDMSLRRHDTVEAAQVEAKRIAGKEKRNVFVMEARHVYGPLNQIIEKAFDGESRIDTISQELRKALDQASSRELSACLKENTKALMTLAQAEQLRHELLACLDGWIERNGVTGGRVDLTAGPADADGFCGFYKTTRIF